MGAREVFERQAGPRRSPEFEGWQGSYKFEVDGVGVWRANVHDGVVEVTEGAAETDCTIRSSEEEFMRIYSGEQNMLTAWMQGRIEAEGDLGLLQRFHGFIRSEEFESRQEQR